MSVLKKLNKWEKTLEHGSQAKKFKILAITFVIALLTGASVANTVRLQHLAEIEKYSQQIRQAEKNRMQLRLEMIRKIKYSQSASRS